MKKLLLTLLLLASLTIGVLPVKALKPASITQPIEARTKDHQILTPIDPATIRLLNGRPATEIPPFLDVYIRAPEGYLETPYVILSGIQSSTNLSQNIILKGFLGEKVFTCNESPCALEVLETSRIVFHAENTNGDFSPPLTAEIIVRKESSGYKVVVGTLSKFTLFTDRCSAIWLFSDVIDKPSWAKFPQDPSELNTEKDLFFLASQLMTNGIVDTKSCPNGGWLGSGPNDCALDLIRPQMEAWQNQFDLSIWTASRDNGIPPIVLKSLIEVESQFWPITQRFFLDEVGLAQINQLGIDVLLRTDSAFYQKTCSTALMKCDVPYSFLSGLDQQILRGSLAASLDARCPTCANGISLDKASNSIPLISKVLYSNCVQTKNILQEFQVSTTYEDAWKITFASYHSGADCLLEAFNSYNENHSDETEITWGDVAENMKCKTGRDYVAKMESTLNAFEQNRKTEYELKLYKATEGAIPSTTSFTSTAKVIVRIFIDKNTDGIQQPDEAVDNVKVDMLLSNGVIESKYSENGLVEFDLTGKTTGLIAKFTLPGLYRTATYVIPANGEIPITFVFIPAINPTSTP
jgi:hypothetical protein